MQAQLPTRWCRIVAITLAAAFTIVAAPAVATHDARADGTISARTTDPLSVRWVAPTDGSTVSSGLIRSRCEVATRDSSAITKVEFFLDGSLVSTDTAPPYSCQFETTTLAGGTHILKARAFDAMGNVLSSYAFVSTPTTGPQPTTVTVQGDSLTVGSWWRMPAELGPSFKLVSVSARIGRPSVKGLALLHRQQLGRTVVFALGTNDWWSTPRAYLKHLTEALQLIGPHRCMAVPTIWHAGRANDALNSVLRSLARLYGPARIQLAPWAQAVAAGQVPMSHGTHPNSQTGWQLRAEIVDAAVRACASEAAPVAPSRRSLADGAA